VQSVSPWTDLKIERLRSLWDDGLSASAIGRALNLSKNAVVGKAHRLDLSARPCPIKPLSGPRQKRTHKPRVPLPPFSGPVCPAPILDVHEKDTEIGPHMLAAPKASLPVSPPALQMSAYRISQCSWPFGDPGTPTFRFCDSPSLPGKPYCAAHASRAYVKASSSGRDAA
jgi:GcrA cell cycle regulator